MSTTVEGPTLKRRLSLPLVTAYGVGTILGAGIYALVGKVAGHAGMLAPWAFLFAAMLAALTALSYGELAARLPKSAGEAVYLHRAFSRRWLSMIVGLLVVVTGVVSAAAIARAFTGYLGVFVELPAWLVITTMVIALGLLAAWGISESITTATVITVVEIAGLLLVAWVARGGLAELPARIGELVPAWNAPAWLGLWLGTFLAFYAFVGFEDMVNVAEEVRDPSRTLPPAILLALGVSTALYVIVALVAVLAMPVDELAASDAPMAEVWRRTAGSNPAVITLISLVAVINGTLVQIIMGSRILYGLSRAGWLPPVFGRVNARTRTPLAATAVVTAVVLVLALFFPLVGLAEATTFVILIVFALVNLALWRIKRADPRPEGIRVHPLWVPVAGVLVCAGSVVMKLLTLFGVVRA